MNAIRAVVVVGFSLFLLLLVGPAILQNPPWPYTGVTAARTPGFSSSYTARVAPGSPAYRAGLRTGDRIACLSVRDQSILFPMADSAGPRHLLYTGNPISLCAYHNGAWHAVSFAPERMPPAGYIYGSLAGEALRLAVLTLFLFVGCLLVIARPSPATWLLFGYCAGNVPGLFPHSMLLWLPPAAYAVAFFIPFFLTAVGPPLLALFTLVVSTDRMLRGWRRTACYVIAVAAIVPVAMSVAFVMLPDLNFRGSSLLGTTLLPVDGAFTVATVLLVIARLATMEREERARFGWAAFAIIFGIICNEGRILSGTLLGFVSSLLTVVMPLALMYAILRRHVIDVRFVLSRTVVYGVITTLVVGIIGLVDWATSAYLSATRAALAIDAAVTIALGFALHRTYRWIEHAVDAILFREKHEAQTYLRRAARALLRARDERTVDLALVNDPVEKLDLTMAALFRGDGSGFTAASTMGWEGAAELAFPPGCEIARFLEAERTCVAIADLRKHVTAEFVEAGALPAVAIPIFRGDDLFAFALYGFHRHGTRLDPDELEALERFCEAAAQAYVMLELKRYTVPPATLSPALERL